jgi:DNA-binding response OmpR family regulator
MAFRISVINDFEPFLDVMQTLLEEEGYEVDIVHESIVAEARVRSFKPDLIVLDLRLEKPDTGWQLLELFRLDPELAVTPVIVCSADIVGLRDREDVFERHGIRALEKPFHLEELLDLLRAMLPQQGNQH